MHKESDDGHEQLRVLEREMQKESDDGHEQLRVLNQTKIDEGKTKMSILLEEAELRLFSPKASLRSAYIIA